MKTRLLLMLVVAALGLTARAKAATMYYLVGTRHVYLISAYPDSHELDRQQIEEDYAAAVADAQKHYDSDMASIHDEETHDSGNIHQQDRDAVQENLEKDIADASDRREAALTQFYSPCDSVRSSHPEFNVDQDGPYKVVGIDTTPTGDYTNVVYYQPYPMYLEPCPFGWAWGVPYPYLNWGVQVRLFHSMWITIGCPFFTPMYYGGGVFVFSAPVRSEVILNRSGWVGGRPPHVTAAERAVLAQNYQVQKNSGYFDKGPGGRALSEFKKPTTPAQSSRYATPSGASKYSHSGSTSKYSHTLSGTSSSTTSSRYGRGTSNGTAPATGSTGVSKYSRTSPYQGSSSSATGVSRYTRNGAATSSSTSRYGHGGPSNSDPRPASGPGGSTSGSASSGSSTGGAGHGSSTSGSTGHSSSGGSSGSGSHPSGGNPPDPKKHSN